MGSGTDDYRTEKQRREEMMDIGDHHKCVNPNCNCEEQNAKFIHPDPSMVPPSHYDFGVYEVFKVASAWGFWSCAAKFSALKYLARAGKKDGESEIKDLEKAIHYLKVRVQHLKEEGNK